MAKRKLTELFAGKVDGSELYLNPDSDEAKKFRRGRGKNVHSSFRAVFNHETGQLLAWKAGETWHQTMINALGTYKESKYRDPIVDDDFGFKTRNLDRVRPDVLGKFDPEHCSSIFVQRDHANPGHHRVLISGIPVKVAGRKTNKHVEMERLLRSPALRSIVGTPISTVTHDPDYTSANYGTDRHTTDNLDGLQESIHAKGVRNKLHWDDDGEEPAWGGHGDHKLGHAVDYAAQRVGSLWNRAAEHERTGYGTAYKRNESADPTSKVPADREALERAVECPKCGHQDDFEEWERLPDRSGNVPKRHCPKCGSTEPPQDAYTFEEINDLVGESVSPFTHVTALIEGYDDVLTVRENSPVGPETGQAVATSQDAIEQPDEEEAEAIEQDVERQLYGGNDYPRLPFVPKKDMKESAEPGKTPLPKQLPYGECDLCGAVKLSKHLPGYCKTCGRQWCEQCAAPDEGGGGCPHCAGGIEESAEPKGLVVCKSCNAPSYTSSPKPTCPSCGHPDVATGDEALELAAHLPRTLTKVADCELIAAADDLLNELMGGDERMSGRARRILGGSSAPGVAAGKPAKHAEPVEPTKTPGEPAKELEREVRKRSAQEHGDAHGHGKPTQGEPKKPALDQKVFAPHLWPARK